MNTYPPLVQRYLATVDGHGHASAVRLLSEADELLREFLRAAEQGTPTAPGGSYEPGSIHPRYIERTRKLLQAL